MAYAHNHSIHSSCPPGILHKITLQLHLLRNNKDHTTDYHIVGHSLPTYVIHMLNERLIGWMKDAFLNFMAKWRGWDTFSKAHHYDNVPAVKGNFFTVCNQPRVHKTKLSLFVYQLQQVRSQHTSFFACSATSLPKGGDMTRNNLAVSQITSSAMMVGAIAAADFPVRRFAMMTSCTATLVNDLPSAALQKTRNENDVQQRLGDLGI